MGYTSRLAISGVILSLLATAAGLLFQTQLAVVDAAGWAQAAALVLILIAGLRGSRWWLLAVLLVAAGSYLWLLEQGH